MVKAIEVALDGEVIGTCVPPPGGCFVVHVGNIPRSHMRVHVMSSTETETWSWQLADVKERQTLSLRMVDARPGSGLTPGRITPSPSTSASAPRKRIRNARKPTNTRRSARR
jgi:hypothetical protein